jgi:PAS domain S-box-containing protein
MFFSGISYRIWLPFAVSITLFILAAGFYYPKKQEQIFIDNYKYKIKELSKTVALGVELTLSSDNFEGLKKTIDLAKSSSEFEFIAIVETVSGGREEVFMVNPDSFETTDILNIDTLKYLYEKCPIKTEALNGYVMIAFSKEDIHNTIFTLNYPVYQFLIILLVVSLIAFLFFADTISKPIRNLTSVANNLENENFNVVIQEVKDKDELSNLNNALFSLKKALIAAKIRNDEFNKQLEDEIQVRTKDLKEVTDKLIQAQITSKMGSFEFDVKSTKWNFSSYVYKILQLDSIENLNEENWCDILTTDDKIEILEFFEESIKLKKTFQKDFKLNFTVESKDERWISIVGEPILDASNNVIMVNGTIQDITERKIIENEVNRLSLVAKKTSNCVIITDKHRKITWVNDSVLKLTGYTFEEIDGKSPKMFQSPRTNPDTIKYIQECLNSDKEIKVEILNMSKDGTEYWLDMNIVPLFDQKNELTGYIAVESDITERKRFEEQILEIKNKLESILNEINDVVWSIDLRTKETLFTSPSSAKLYETEKQSWVNRTEDFWHKIVLPEDQEIIHDIQDQLRQDGNYEVSFRIICPGNKIKWVNSKGKIIFNAQNEPVRLDGIDSDITDIKLSIERQKMFIKEAPSAMAMLDDQLHYLTVSDKWLGDYDLNNQNIISASHFDYFPEDRTDWEKIFRECLSGTTFALDEYKFKKTDGSIMWLKLKINPWYSDSDKIGGIIILTEDITKIKESKEEELRHILKLTQSQNDRLRNFAHIVSHNLRSHSGNIQSLVSLIIEERPELSEDELIMMIRQSSDNLIETIGHLSEVAMMNVKESEQLSSINIYDTLEKAINNVNALAKNSKVKIYNELNGDEIMYGIPAYLDSILLNFLTNGIKYKSPDRDAFVKVSSERVGNFEMIKIEDNGLGIDMKRHGAKLFGMYKTFHKNSDARGIGLFITKNQIEAMGGRIEVDSEVGVGTTFKIYFKTEVEVV